LFCYTFASVDSKELVLHKNWADGALYRTSGFKEESLPGVQADAQKKAAAGCTKEKAGAGLPHSKDKNTYSQ
jgi:hypothetical protein